MHVAGIQKNIDILLYVDTSHLGNMLENHDHDKNY